MLAARRCDAAHVDVHEGAGDPCAHLGKATAALREAVLEAALEALQICLILTVLPLTVCARELVQPQALLGKLLLHGLRLRAATLR